MHTTLCYYIWLCLPLQTLFDTVWLWMTWLCWNQFQFHWFSLTLFDSVWHYLCLFCSVRLCCLVLFYLIMYDLDFNSVLTFYFAWFLLFKSIQLCINFVEYVKLCLALFNSRSYAQILCLFQTHIFLLKTYFGSTIFWINDFQDQHYFGEQSIWPLIFVPKKFLVSQIFFSTTFRSKHFC